MARTVTPHARRMTLFAATVLLSTLTVGVANADHVRTTSLSSVATDGTQADGASSQPQISSDGTVTSFTASASNLVVGDTNGQDDVFVHDNATGETIRISVRSDGTQADNRSDSPSLSGDGTVIAFVSSASNLVPKDTNSQDDVFVHDTTTGETIRVSVASDGIQGNNQSSMPAISDDGTVIAFRSSASNLVPGDTNGFEDVFVHDTTTGETIRVSVASDGTQGNLFSLFPEISGDGTVIAFQSFSSNLVAGDTNGQDDVFVHDTTTGQTTLVSVASDGTQGNGQSALPAISANGAVIAFQSFASNLVGGDTNGKYDVFVHDTTTGETTRVSVASDGTQSLDHNWMESSAISAAGTAVVFYSSASNLVDGDVNGYDDVFVHDIVTGETSRISVASDGADANGWSYAPAISGDGTVIVYQSFASNLVPDDINGLDDVFVATDIDHTPIATGFTTAVAEDAGHGTVVGTVDATDPDPLTYAITDGNSSGLFAVSDSGAVTVAGVLDYETAATHSLTVTVSDATHAVDVDVVVDVIDVDEAPSADGFSSSVSEDAEIGAVVGTVTADDPDSDVLGFAITAGNSAGLFAVSGSGAVSVAAGLDYETATTHSLTVSVSDATHNVDVTVIVSVTDVVEVPETVPGVTRVGGADRYGTAVAASRDAFPDGAEVVYIVTGGDFPDGLTAGPAAIADGAPILPISGHTIPTIVKHELDRLNPNRIVIIGGIGVVNQDVESQLGGYTDGTVERIAGPDRYATAAAISGYLYPTGDVPVVYIATGLDFPDAIAGGPLANNSGGPILLVNGSIPTTTIIELIRLNPDRIVILGGPGAVSAGIEADLADYGTVERVAGTDRYATAAAISATLYPEGNATVYVATGSDFPDALASAQAITRNPGPILLIHPNSIPTATTNELKRLKPARIVIIGGIDAISSHIETTLNTHITP